MRHLRKLHYLILLFGFQTAFAGNVRLTMYDDGLSCPANCDAHVVFDQTLNGTEYAHDPHSLKEPFTKCTLGSVCRLCIKSGGRQCLEAIYRGSGPPAMTFDFTPAFYTNACKSTPTQQLLAAKCAELKKASAQFVGRINCILTPRARECTSLIVSATSARMEDRAKFDQCIKEGQQTYNTGRPRVEQRSLNCAYEKYGTGGPNSKGVTWRKLLPGQGRAQMVNSLTVTDLTAARAIF